MGVTGYHSAIPSYGSGVAHRCIVKARHPVSVLQLTHKTKIDPDMNFSLFTVPVTLHRPTYPVCMIFLLVREGHQ
jgi:hypothetical protein